MSYGNSLPKHMRYIQLYMPQIGKDGVEEKKEIFLQELEDFKAKTNLRISVPKFDSLTYVL